jgi:hypothetical protein
MYWKRLSISFEYPDNTTRALQRVWWMYVSILEMFSEIETNIVVLNVLMHQNVIENTLPKEFKLQIT